jgi:hypothetical protein
MFNSSQTHQFINFPLLSFQEMFQKETDLEEKLTNLSIKEPEKVCN